MEKVSIIVPIYNKEPYLERCIESVLRQSYSNFDLILVDDGSVDRCGEICDRYQSLDPRISVIHQSNRGLSLARNMGIHHACTVSDSKWISFLDADDALHPRFLEVLLREAESSDSKTIAACRLKKIRPGDQVEEIHEFPAREIDINTLYSIKGKDLSGLSVCGKLFPKEIFIRIRFPAGLYNEDMYTCPVLMHEVDRIVYVDAGMYEYYMLSDSYVHSDWQPKKMQEINAAEFVARYLKNIGCEDAHLGALLRIRWIVKRQRKELLKSPVKYKLQFLIYFLGKELQIRRRIRYNKKRM